MKQQLVLGIDGGGTYTRVAVGNFHGEIVGFSKTAGSHPGKNQNPERNVKIAIHEALKVANQTIDSISWVVGGFAGLNEPNDVKWAQDFLAYAGIDAPNTVVNDAEVAHYGAFMGRPGVLALAGTGSIVCGKTEEGKIIKNYDFHHDSEAAARFLSYSSIYEVITSSISIEEQKFINSILEYWSVPNIESLRILASKGFANNQIEAIQKLSDMGVLVTTGAMNGSQIAQRACKKVVGSLVTGVELVASMFLDEVVLLSSVGGVATNPYIQSMLLEELNTGMSVKKMVFQQPQLSPVLGAVLHAYQKLGIEVNRDIINNLTLAQRTRGRF